MQPEKKSMRDIAITVPLTSLESIQGQGVLRATALDEQWSLQSPSLRSLVSYEKLYIPQRIAHVPPPSSRPATVAGTRDGEGRFGFNLTDTTNRLGQPHDTCFRAGHAYSQPVGRPSTALPALNDEEPQSVPAAPIPQRNTRASTRKGWNRDPSSDINSKAWCSRTGTFTPSIKLGTDPLKTSGVHAYEKLSRFTKSNLTKSSFSSRAMPALIAAQQASSASRPSSRPASQLSNRSRPGSVQGNRVRGVQTGRSNSRPATQQSQRSDLGL